MINGAIEFQGIWTGSNKDEWRLSGKITLVNGSVDSKGSSGITWKYVGSPKTAVMQRYYGYEGKTGFELLEGTIQNDVLNLKTKNIDWVLLRWYYHTITLNFTENTFSGNSVSILEKVGSDESADSGDMRGVITSKNGVSINHEDD